jgi:hypothetical protein
MLTEDQFRLALPEKMKKSVNQELIDKINNTISDPELLATYRDNLIGFSRILQDGKFQIQQYVDAVRYVGFKVMGYNNIESYSRTFPDKITDFNNRGVAAKDIASYVTAYNKGKLVNLIMEQTLIPVHIYNMDLYQKALNVQADLMMSAHSEKVRSDAANSILTQLRPPETKKVELEINHREDDSIRALKETTMELVAAQRQMLQAGMMDAQQVAHQKLTYTDVEVTEVKP